MAAMDMEHHALMVGSVHGERDGIHDGIQKVEPPAMIWGFWLIFGPI